MKKYFKPLVASSMDQEKSNDWEGRIELFLNILKSELKLPLNKAWNIIMELQEIIGIIPSNFELCDICGDIYDSYRGGYHSEIVGKCFCEAHAWNNDYIAFCADCNNEVPLKSYSKRYCEYLCSDCRKERLKIKNK